jgi:hypothetical protein
MRAGLPSSVTQLERHRFDRKSNEAGAKMVRGLCFRARTLTFKGPDPAGEEKGARTQTPLSIYN